MNILEEFIRERIDKNGLIDWCSRNLPNNKIITEKISNTVANFNAFAEAIKNMGDEGFMEFFGVDKMELISIKELKTIVELNKLRMKENLNKLDISLNVCLENSNNQI